MRDFSMSRAGSTIPNKGTRGWPAADERLDGIGCSCAGTAALFLLLALVEPLVIFEPLALAKLS